MSGLLLHSYWRATAPYRVRIGLNLKGLPYDYAGVNLATGEQHGEAYRALNVQQLTPAIETEGQVLTQSLSILEWLEERHPAPPILPADPFDRQVARAMADIIACDVHPLNNLRIARKLAKMGIDQAGVLEWTQGWIRDGFDALEPMIARYGRGFAFGDTPTIADCCIVPGAYSAERYQVALDPWPATAAAVANARAHPAIQAAHPDRQPDAKPVHA